MYQKVTILGNLGGDPEMRYFQDGTPVTNFSVATNRRWKTQDGEPREETVWFRVSVFGRQAEACNEYLSTGRMALVEGRLTADENGGPRLWTAQDGTVRASFELRADTVRFVGGAGDASLSASPHASSQPAQQQEEDEIPF